jgi:hypothetical protein
MGPGDGPERKEKPPRRWPRRLALALLLPAAAWITGWLSLRPWLPAWVSGPAAAAFAAGFGVLAFRSGGRRLPAAAGLVAAALLGVLLERVPAEGPWSPGQERISRVSFAGSRVRIEDMRDYRWGTAGEVTPGWRTGEFDLDALDRCWLGVVPLDDRGLAAHTLLLFTFRDGKALALSVEGRRRPGQPYRPVNGMLRAYPLVYVLGDPRDVLGLRARAWGNRILLLPVKPDRGGMRAALRAALERAGRIAEEGAFYNTLVDNCTTTLARHASAATPLPFTTRTILNGRVGEFALENGLLDIDLPWPEAEKRFRAEERIRVAEEGDLGAWLRAATGETEKR